MKYMNEAQRQFAERALRIYDARWKKQLETEHWGEVIAIEPESGDYVLGTSLSDVASASRNRFGRSRVHIFRVGGGGAVRVGGSSRARIS